MRFHFAACAAAFLSLAILSAPAAADPPAPSKAKLGERIPNLKFTDHQGKSLVLHDLKDQEAIVFVFLSFECPVSNSYCPTLVDMVKEFGKHGVTFIGLTTNDDDSRADIAKHGKEFGLNFAVYKDEGLRAAQALQADYTPEAFVLDGDFTLRYRGRIDDSWSERLKKHQKVSRHDLSQVLGEILSGRPVAVPATQAIGCAIPRAQKQLAQSGPATYYRDVVPILQNHCQTCHRPGEVGPFSLMTYKQTVNWAPDIKSYTQKRTMPPWKPAAGASFLNERKLTDEQITTLATWADHGTPAGNPDDAPPPRKFPEGWQLGKPDLILAADSEFTLGPDGRDVFRCFVLPTKLLEDHYVTAVEIRPTNNRVVHHVLLFVDTSGQARRLEKQAQLNQTQAKQSVDEQHPQKSQYDKGPGYSVAMGVGFIPTGGLMGWAPGSVPRFLPEGTGLFLPKNADVVMQVHYHRNGRLERDCTQVGLHLAKKPVDRRFLGGVLAGADPNFKAPAFLPERLSRLYFSIPAGAERFNLKGDSYASADFMLHFVTPHMHMLGKEMTVTMTPPEGPTRTLIDIKSWDYNWQETYILKEPISVKAGTKFHVEAFYDNSANNPLNPNNPPYRVTFGEQTDNEMCFVFLGGTSDTPIPGRRGLPMSATPPKR